jgi:hypothetical protein
MQAFPSVSLTRGTHACCSNNRCLEASMHRFQVNTIASVKNQTIERGFVGKVSRRKREKLGFCHTANWILSTRAIEHVHHVSVATATEETTISDISMKGVNPQQNTYGPNAHITATGRIVAIGDIHGDIQKLLDCLVIAGLVLQDEDGLRWIGGDATVVQLGDVLDRGDAEISTVLLLRELDKQARHHGGAVYMLNGNHESLNVAGDFRYVTPGAFWESAMAAGLSEEEARTSNEAILQARWSLYRPGGVMAKEFSRNPTVLIINNEIVFAHGGLLPHHVSYGVQRINDEVARWMKGADCSDGSSPSPPFTAMGDSNSVMWNRTFGKERCSPYDRMHMKMQLDATLDQLGAKAMVVGHTPQMSGLNAECNGRIWRVDVGMSSGVLNADAQVLEFSKDDKGNLQASLLTREYSPYA